jgi:hypothetical protein
MNIFFQRDFGIHKAAKKDFWYGFQLDHLDKTLLVAFPFVFLLFNVIYWPVCLA